MCEVFVLLAGSASFDIFRNPSVHVGPGVDLFCLSNCFISSRVAGGRMIMSVDHDVLEVLVSGSFGGDCYSFASVWG